ncbi:hypothetical protein [Streptomyces sp. V3I7]|uniref:hypothetical protein n=1 Tax=Streptomyces sp. V3I7 TaxID=3042278 RepID=UPI0027814008|nr:hypothetical protein [Streptomyces sp. V3I7]MDQ0989624.1 hypothetical protein [Streptomyces sp. V3I7]
MGGLLSELGKKLAERWVSLLVLPGALYLAVAVAARALGHGHPFDPARLADRVAAWAGAPWARDVGGQVVVLLAVLGGSVVVGLAAQALGSLVERLWLAAGWPTWPVPLRTLARRRVAARRRRWEAAARRYRAHREEAGRARALGRAVDPAERWAAHAGMTRVSPERPARPTWCGDRVQAVAFRLERHYGLDLAVVWPSLWLILPDTPRAEINTARETLARATALFAWALLYLPLAVFWWPAALISAVLALTSRVRARAATETYALLLESAVRLHTADLAGRLGVDHSGPPTPELGTELKRLLVANPSPPPAD